MMKNCVTSKHSFSFAVLSEQFLMIFLSMSFIHVFPAAIQPLNAGR